MEINIFDKISFFSGIPYLLFAHAFSKATAMHMPFPRLHVTTCTRIFQDIAYDHFSKQSQVFKVVLVHLPC